MMPRLVNISPRGVFLFAMLAIVFAMGCRGRAQAASVAESAVVQVALTGQVGPELSLPALAKDEEKSSKEDARAANSSGEPTQNKDKATVQPLTFESVTQWFKEHGPTPANIARMIGILIGMLILYVVVKRSGKHLVKVVARGAGRGSLHERENRAVTLVGVFQNVASLVILGGGALMILDELGIPILPLMGVASVLGLAVAFGSQNLIKDYFSGVMLLLEDQYGINDVVKIGDVAGAVEQITLRITVLRDLEGTLHFIPHGTITTVSNMTHGWSRALVDIGVAYKEDTDRVVDEMLKVARELREDSKFGPMTIDDAEMLGVDVLGDSAVSIKMFIKTQPLMKWAVRREYLRRIKHRFDKLGIEIPFPHRTVFLQTESGAEAKSDKAPD